MPNEWFRRWPACCQCQRPQPSRRCIEEGGPWLCVEYDLGLFNIFVPLTPDQHLTMSIKRRAGERQDTDETTVNLLAFKRGGTWVRLDDREAKGLAEDIGENNRFCTNGTTTEMVRAAISWDGRCLQFG